MSYIKYFELKPHPTRESKLGQYLLLPFKNRTIQDIVENLKRMPSDKDPEYFDINNVTIDLSQIDGLIYDDFYPINVSEYLNVNISDSILDLTNSNAQYINNDNGNLKLLSKIYDYKLFIQDDEFKYVNLNSDLQEKGKVIQYVEEYLTEYNPEEGEEGYLTPAQIHDLQVTKVTSHVTSDSQDISEYRKILNQSGSFTNDTRRQIVYYLEDTYKNGDLILNLTFSQASKVISQNSDLYIFFENPNILQYNDFYLDQQKYGKEEIATYTNKFLFLRFDLDLWVQYKELIQELGNKDDPEEDIIDKFNSVTSFIIQSDNPVYFTKGTQPGFLFDNYKISPFIREKSNVLFRSKLDNIVKSFDMGSIFELFKFTSLNDVKGILPYSLSLFIADSTQDIQYSKFYRNHRQIKNREEYSYCMVYDEPITLQMTNSQFVELLYDQKSEQQSQILDIFELGIDRKNYIIDQFFNIRQILLSQNKIQVTGNEVEDKYNINIYLSEIGFDVNDEEGYTNFYGFLKTYDPLDYNQTDKSIGVIQYSTPQLLLFFNQDQQYSTSGDPIFQSNILNKFNNIYLNFNYYFYVNQLDIDRYRAILGSVSEELTDDEIEELIYKEYLEYYVTTDQTTGFNYISIPIISKVENINRQGISQPDIFTKFQIYETNMFNLGNLVSNRILKDHQDFEDSQNIKYINGKIPIKLNMRQSIEGNIQMLYETSV